MNLAPVILFTYKRLNHTKSTINSLLSCKEASDTCLYIFSDAPKSNEDIIDVFKVRNYIKTIVGFKNISITYRENNYGLAKNIECGLNEIFSDHRKAIILEDDIIVSPFFLIFMNNALLKYENNRNIWHISGWNYPIRVTDQNYQYNSFFLQLSNCWGWATWANRWEYYEKNPIKISQNWSINFKKRFTLNGANKNFWKQISHNKNNKINTWAIFWYASIFQNNGLCLNPVVTYTRNIGNDGTGENCDSNDIFISELNNKFSNNFPIDINIENSFYNLIREFYIKNKLTIWRRIINKGKKIIRQ